MSALEALYGRFLMAHKHHPANQRTILSFGAYPAAGKETTLLALANLDPRFANAERINKTFNSPGPWPARYANHIRLLAANLNKDDYQDKSVLVKNATPLSFFLRLIAEAELSKSYVFQPLNRIHFSDRSIQGFRDQVIANSELTLGDTVYQHWDESHFIYPRQIIRRPYHTNLDFVDAYYPRIGDSALNNLMFAANYRLTRQESVSLDSFIEQAASWILTLDLDFIPFRVYFLNRPTILSNFFFTASDQTHANPNRSMWMQVLCGQRKMWLKLAELMPEIVFPIDCDVTPGIPDSPQIVAQLTYARMLANGDL